MVNTEIRLILFLEAEDGEAKIRHESDCDSFPEFLIAKIIFKLKKVGKTPRLFRYDLNQIPYAYTVGVTNRFKGLECLKNYGQRGS